MSDGDDKQPIHLTSPMEMYVRLFRDIQAHNDSYLAFLRSIYSFFVITL